MKTDLRSNVFWLIFNGMDFIHVKADNMNFSLKKNKTKKKIEVKKVNVPVTGKHALLFLVVFVPLLYTVYVLFMLFGCTLVEKNLLYKRIYYPVYDTLSTINHGNI